jgi:phosphoglycerate kinase
VVIGTRFDADAAADTGAASLDVLAARLCEQLGVESLLPDECVGDAVVRVLNQLRPGQICLLPDLSLEPGERSNDERFARALASTAGRPARYDRLVCRRPPARGQAHAAG